MKNKLKILLAMVLFTIVFPIRSNAYDIEVNKIYYNVISDTERTCEVTYPQSKYEYRGDIIIPSTVVYKDNTFSVIGIEDEAFSKCKDLTSIEIPNSVKRIGDRAFYGCSSLTSIEIGNSVTRIGYEAFSWCSSLTSIEIPNSVTIIDIGAFSACSSLTSIEIGNSVTSIRSEAFRGCSSLTSIEIPNSVDWIGYCAFSGCGSLKKINLSNNLNYLDFGLFEYCKNLSSLTIPGEIEFINFYYIDKYGSPTITFGGCDKLNSLRIEYNDLNLTAKKGLSYTPEYVSWSDERVREFTNQIEILYLDRKLEIADNDDVIKFNSLKELTLG